MDLLLELHDRTTSTELGVTIVAIGAVAWALGRSLRGKGSWLAVRATVVTAASAAVASAGPSGTVLRTRRGLPHFFVTSSGGEPVWHFAYLTLDWLFWFALLACVSAVLATVKRPPVR